MPAGLAGRAWSQDTAAGMTARLHADLETHASFGLKYSCSPGDEATAAWTAERLRNIGYRVELPEFDAPYFAPRTTEVRIGSTAVDVFPQGPVAVTPPNGIRAPLAVIEEDGQIGDVRGKIAVVVAPFGRHAALYAGRGIGGSLIGAAEAGALGIVLVTTGPTGEVCGLNCPAEKPFVPVPVALLAPKLADPVVSAARAGADATLIVDGDATPQPCKNIIARLERGPEWIAMSSPRSGWFHCVAERGTGQAAFHEIADWLVDRYPQHSIFLMNTGAHEYFFAGSHAILDQGPPPEATVAWAHIGATLAVRASEEVDGELVMLDTADTQRSTMASDAARDAVARGFAGLTGYENPGPVRATAGELSAFTDHGYEKAFACLALHNWFHTIQDTLERVDARLLTPVVRAHQATIEELVDA